MKSFYIRFDLLIKFIIPNFIPANVNDILLTIKTYAHEKVKALGIKLKESLTKIQ